MSEHWPPDADDYDEVAAGEADKQGTDAAARLSVVSAFLASVPAPVLPPDVGARISAAIAAEAAARTAARANAASAAPGRRDTGAAPGDQGPAGGSPAGDSPARDSPARESPAAGGAVRSRTLGRSPRRARVRRPGRVFRLSGTLAAVCLVLAGFGFLLAHSPGSSSSSSAASGSAASGTAAGPAAAPAGSAAGSAPAAGPGSGTKRISAAGPEALRPSGSARRAAFTVTESGTAYLKADLAGQVRSVLASQAASGGTGAVPPAGLLGCVLRFTGAPALVDRATYQGTPAYVIASASRVWVVGRGCTASAPEVMASDPLTGLPGIFAP